MLLSLEIELNENALCHLVSSCAVMEISHLDHRYTQSPKADPSANFHANIFISLRKSAETGTFKVIGQDKDSLI